MNINIEDKLMASRAQMLNERPQNAFYGTLACNFNLVAKPGFGTIANDIRNFIYDPKVIEEWTVQNLKFAWAHEIEHVMHEHLLPEIRGGRDHVLFNFAADFWINDVLIEDGFVPPVGKDGKQIVCYDVKYKGWTVYAIYDDIIKNAKKITINCFCKIIEVAGDANKEKDGEKGLSKDGKPSRGVGVEGGKDQSNNDKDKKNGLGDISPDDLKDFKEQITMAAQIAAGAGQLPGRLQAIIEKLNKPKVDWKRLLYRFLSHMAKQDYSYRRPSRRYMQRGIILPTLFTEDLPPIAVAIDSSGSIDDKELEQFVSELVHIARCGFNFTIHLITCDMDAKYTKVRSKNLDWRKIDISGRGGTAFTPVFDLVDEKHLNPAALIYLTDGDPWEWPKKKPRYPVMWILCRGDRDVPFGQKVLMNCHE